ncbi:MAG: DUF262 domain-containing protein [bacterium]|nr:DUF262 domain-containing protein [bacterium]
MENWEIKKTLYRVSDFMSWKRIDSLMLSPSFQRRNVWRKDAKSFLIDTVVRGLPMPLIFLREQKSDIKTLEPKREVVDGQQRIRTLLSFIDKNILKDFKEGIDDFVVKEIHNKNIAGKRFSELDDKIKQRILDYEFSVHILPTSVGDREVLQIFARMNATGVKLNDQELRNAEYYGDFKTSMYNLASEQLTRWRNWKIFTEYNIARMEEVELTSDLVNLIIFGIRNRSKNELNKLYKNYDDKFPNKIEVENRFRNIIESINEEIGENIKNTAFSKKTLFYILFSIFYHAKYEIKSPLKKISAKPISKDFVKGVLAKGEQISNGKASQSVLEASRRQTTNEKNRKILFNYFKSR